MGGRKEGEGGEGWEGRVCLCVCVYVCEWESEGERGKTSEREREREQERGGARRTNERAHE